MPAKLTFFYHDNLGGFSESWYDNNNNAATFPIGLVAAYLFARMSISGQETTFDYLRITDNDPALARRVRIALPTNPTLRALGVPLTGTYQESRNSSFESADFSGTRLLVRKQSADLFQARFFLAGFPDSQCDKGGQYIPFGQFPNLFTIFENVLKQNAWGWKSYTTPLPGFKAALTTAITGLDGTATITVSPIGVNPPPFLPPINPGDNIVVRISGQNNPKNLNGTFTVKVLTPTSFRTVKPLSITNFIAGNGTVAIKKTVATKVVDQLIIERIVKRGPGRPFGLYRGRQSNRPKG